MGSSGVWLATIWSRIVVDCFASFWLEIQSRTSIRKTTSPASASDRCDDRSLRRLQRDIRARGCPGSQMHAVVAPWGATTAGSLPQVGLHERVHLKCSERMWLAFRLLARAKVCVALLLAIVNAVCLRAAGEIARHPGAQLPRLANARGCGIMGCHNRRQLVTGRFARAR